MFNFAANVKPLLTIINGNIMVTNNNIKLRYSVVNSAMSSCEYSCAAQYCATTERKVCGEKGKSNLIGEK